MYHLVGDGSGLDAGNDTTMTMSDRYRGEAVGGGVSRRRMIVKTKIMRYSEREKNRCLESFFVVKFGFDR